jgi:hypothetical protein
MEQKALARWLKVILAGVGLCGLIVYLLVIPSYGKWIVADYPEFANRFRPWLFFLWATGVPCCVALFFGWKIAGNIGANRSFIQKNADYLKWIAWLAAGDAGFFFLGNIVLLLVNMSHPGMILFSLLIVFACIAVAVAAAVLSHLVKKAADLQEQSDLTI